MKTRPGPIFISVAEWSPRDSAAGQFFGSHIQTEVSERMSGGYMTRLFPKSNSSLLLHTGTALKSTVHRLRDDKYFLLDSAGIASPKLCLRDALTRVPSNTSFHNKVGFMGKPGPETEVNRSFLERYFIDIVAGDATAKAIATARVFDLIGGSADGTGSSNEPFILPPRKYRQKQALMELNKLWRQNKKVNGFILEKVRGGYLVAIGGYIAFLRFRPLINQKIMSSCSFTISSIGFIGKRPDIVVF